MKMILTEQQILTNIRLSGVQKTLLAKIVAAPTPQLAYDQISDGRNFVATRDILQKLRLIDFDDGTASITEEGKKVMKDENLMDDSEQLTSDGQKYVEAKNANDIDNPTSGQADDDASTMPGAEGEDPFGGEPGAEDPMGGEPGAEGEDPFDFSKSPEDEENPISKKTMENFCSLIQAVNKGIHSFEKTVSPVKFTLREVCKMEAGEDLSDNLLDKLQRFVVEYDSTWMPVHVQKARLSDPHNWIMTHLDQIITAINKPSTK